MILDRIKKLKFYRDNREIVEDGAKHIIAVPHILATLVNLWPMDLGKRRSIAFFLIFISFVHELSLFMYIFMNISNVDSLLISVSSVTIGIQSMTKAILFIYKSHHLKRLIKIIWEEFWPSNLVGHDTDRQIRKDSSKQLFIFLTQCVAGTGFLLMYIVIPITKSSRQLPHDSWYPFDVLETPAYEILIVLQFFLTFYVFQCSVCAYDLAHVAQLLMYCAVSNELSYWSVCFAEEAFKSQWYEKEYANIRKCLSVVIMRSQTAISMNTLGVFELNYVSFLAVMRFTFSLYTFLSRMAN